MNTNPEVEAFIGQLHHPLEGAIQRGYGDRDFRGSVGGEFGEQVEVSRYQKILRDHHHGVPELREHFETAPRDSSGALDRLVRVRDPGECQQPGSPPRRGKLIS